MVNLSQPMGALGNSVKIEQCNPVPTQAEKAAYQILISQGHRNLLHSHSLGSIPFCEFEGEHSARAYQGKLQELAGCRIDLAGAQKLQLPSL